MLKIVQHKSIWFTLSAILVLGAVLAVGIFGFKESAEFKGGTLWEFTASQPSATSTAAGAGQAPSLSDVQNFFVNNLSVTDAVVSYDAQHQIFLARFGTVDETTHQALLAKLQAQYPSTTELSFESIGPSVGAALRKNVIIALILVLLGISLYIAFAFRKTSRPVSSWTYGWITLITLFHDVSIPAGLLAVLGKLKGVEIDTNAVVALLVVMGFSVHDTIVVFDRVRENLSLNRAKRPFGDVVNESVNQSLARSINTSLTLILVLVALLVFGPPDLFYFTLLLLVGVITGIYSSIFIASPLLVAVSPKEGK